MSAWESVHVTEPKAPERDDVELPVHHAQHRRSGRSSGAAWLRESAIIVVSALVLSLLVKTFLVQAFFIPSPSMHNTLIEGDRVLVSKLTPGPFQLHRGDIIVFKDPGGWLFDVAPPKQSALQTAITDTFTFVGLLPQDAGEHLIKRVIGLPGDHVAAAAAGSPVTVNGVPLSEPYLAPGSIPSEIPFDVTVPPGELWVMGDNRQHSADSRYNLGRPGGPFVPMKDVVGVAFVKVWPFDRIGVLTNPARTFAAVPPPS
jgi:signal peptidase I